MNIVPNEMISRRRVCRMLASILLAAQGVFAQGLDVTWMNPPGRTARICEFKVAAPTQGANPFDPDAAALDAAFVAPSGETFRVAGFYIVPHRETTLPPERRVVRRMRIFFGASQFRPGQKIEMLVDDVRLVDTDNGEEAVIDDFESGQPWQEQGMKVWIDTERAHTGRHSLRVSLTVTRRRGWPGFGRRFPDADWERFDELRLWVCPLTAFRKASPSIEFYTLTGKKVQMRLPLVGQSVGKWHEFVWRLPRAKESVRFEPCGEPEWRVRFTPVEVGTYRARFVYRGRRQTLNAERTFTVGGGEKNPFVRVSKTDSRYLEFGPNRPCFLIGMNLLRHFLFWNRSISISRPVWKLI